MYAVSSTGSSWSASSTEQRTAMALVSSSSLLASSIGTSLALPWSPSGSTTKCVTLRFVGSMTMSASFPKGPSVQFTGLPSSRRTMYLRWCERRSGATLNLVSEALARQDGLLLVLHFEHAIERKVAHLIDELAERSRSIVSACAPGRFPGAWVEKWIFCRPSASPRSRRPATRARVSPARRTKEPAGGGRRRTRPARLAAQRAASPRSSGCRSSFSRTPRTRPFAQAGEVASKRSAEATCRHDLVRTARAERIQRDGLVLELGDRRSTTLAFAERPCTGPGCVDSRPARARYLGEAVPELVPPGIRFTGATRTG